jgi:hypothetical protein
MNKLKRLFSPRALAATTGTALLLGAAIAYAADQYSMQAYYAPPDCSQIGHLCQAPNLIYWCCRGNDTCEGYHDTYGWCQPLQGR